MCVRIAARWSADPHYASEVSKATRQTVCYPLALIIVPTRELAHQVFMVAQRCLIGTRALTVRHCALAGTSLNPRVLYGGTDVYYTADSLLGLADGTSGAAHLLVATPGRLLDLVGRGWIDLSRIAVIVFDEVHILVNEQNSNTLRQIMLVCVRMRALTLYSAGTWRHAGRHVKRCLQPQR
jgi:ATP-dependent RNA helicase RhlE